MHHVLYINNSSTHACLWHTAPVKLIELEKYLSASAQVKATMPKTSRQMNPPGFLDMSIPQLMRLTAEATDHPRLHHRCHRRS